MDRVSPPFNRTCAGRYLARPGHRDSGWFGKSSPLGSIYFDRACRFQYSSLLYSVVSRDAHGWIEGADCVDGMESCRAAKWNRHPENSPLVRSSGHGSRNLKRGSSPDRSARDRCCRKTIAEVLRACSRSSWRVDCTHANRIVGFILDRKSNGGHSWFLLSWSCLGDSDCNHRDRL
jgi:hypothetical protein